jgi:hypothetical protein
MRPHLSRLALALSVSVSVALAVAGCGAQRGGATPGQASTDPLPPTATVVSVRVTGGFGVSAERRRTPPQLVVHADGTTVAFGRPSTTLGRDRLGALLSGLRRDLDGLPATIRPHRVAIADAGTVSISVLTDRGTMQTVSANGLSAYPRGFPDRLVHAWRSVSALSAAVQQTR